MHNGGSLVDIVRRQIEYLVRDISKDPRQKSLEFLDLAVRMTHTATVTGDQATLDFFLNGGYVKDFAVLGLGEPGQTAELQPRARASISSSAPVLEEPGVDLDHQASPMPRSGREDEKGSEQGLVRLTSALRKMFPWAQDKRIVTLYTTVIHSDRYREFLHSVPSGKRKQHYVYGHQLDSLKERILGTIPSLNGSYSSKEPSPEVGPSLSEVPSIPAHHRTAADTDIITLPNLAKLLGLSKGDVEKKGITFQKAGTTCYTTVSAISPYLSESQRSKLGEYIQ